MDTLPREMILEISRFMSGDTRDLFRATCVRIRDIFAPSGVTMAHIICQCFSFSPDFTLPYVQHQGQQQMRKNTVWGEIKIKWGPSSVDPVESQLVMERLGFTDYTEMHAQRQKVLRYGPHVGSLVSETDLSSNTMTIFLRGLKLFTFTQVKYDQDEIAYSTASAG